MAIKIGHASIGSNGNIKNDVAGDQNGREVCTRTWYSKPWSYVLRCKDTAKAELMAQACEKGCTNNNIGYDQNQRNTLNAQAKKVNYDLSRITSPCETDCSAFMTVCAQAAGINLPYNGTNAPTTSTMKSAFTSTGMFDVLTGSKYLTSDKYLERGDILVKPGSHTVMALENGSGVNSNTNTHPNTNTYSFKDFVKELQSAIGAKADGIPGNETLSKTVTLSKNKNNRHVSVRPVQKYLNSIGYSCGTADGIAGAKFDNAVKAFQKANGCMSDGIITARNKTWKKLLKLV